MPSRILKDTVCESRSLTRLSVFAQDLYKRLITYADDYGRFNADSQIALARLYPREVGIVTVRDIEDGFTELVGAGKIELYTADPDDDIYGQFPEWAKHQRLRDSKARFPEPGDTSVNDYYQRKFIPPDTHKAVIERDGFKCQICKKYVVAGCSSARRLMKMGAGLYHIDFIVPVDQGGEAKLDNLRLTCPACSSEFQKGDAETICGSSRQVAASRRELRQPAASRGKSRPESESESEVETESENSEAYASCSELPPKRATEPPVAEIVLNTGELYPVTRSDVENWQKLYPAVDVLQELRNMAGWCDANPSKRKTKTGVKRFINGWLAREQDKPKQRQQGGNYANNSGRSELQQRASEHPEWRIENPLEGI